MAMSLVVARAIFCIRQWLDGSGIGCIGIAGIFTVGVFPVGHRIHMKTKEKIVENMSKRNMKFASIIHPTAILTPYSHYGEGLIMFPCAKLSVNSTVGKHVTIMSSGVGHDVKVGDYCTLCGNVTVIRNVMIGDRTYIASNVALNADVHIGNDCYIGMGSMVTKDVPDNSKTFCNPARILPQ